ncbi:OmpA family protein [Lentzea sp. NPDC051213]|uniref:OmpA family protein n=1 Tax=Lentzea sp. NPDC051213 TaxID=3364126 RepID=UPI0037983BD9
MTKARKDRAAPETPAQQSRTRPAESVVTEVQRQAGNRAVAGLLAVQRTSYLAAERRDAAASPGAAVRHPPGPLPPQTIVLAGFAPDSAELKPAHRALLDQLTVSEGLPRRARVVSVAGHTDAVGTAARNSALRQRRAQAVLAYLAGHGMTGGAASAGTGYLDGNDAPSGRAANRAVVILLEATPSPAPAPEQPSVDAGPRRDLDAGVPDGPRDASLPGGLGNTRDLDAGLPPAPAPPVPVEIDVGDEYDATGWLEGFFRTGEVYMSDVNSMVTNVLAATGGQPISRLDVRAHGNPAQIIIGSDVVTVSNFGSFQPVLARLRGHFSAGGFVHLESCTVGQNRALLRRFAAALGVPVYSATGNYNNILRFNTGDYVVCQPDGTCTATTRP